MNKHCNYIKQIPVSTYLQNCSISKALICCQYGSCSCDAAFGGYVPSRWMLASLVTTVASTYALVMLLRDNNASWVIPQTQPLVLMLTAVTGRVVFQERLSARQLLGVLLIIAAVFLLQHKPTNKTLPLERVPSNTSSTRP